MFYISWKCNFYAVSAWLKDGGGKLKAARSLIGARKGKKVGQVKIALPPFFLPEKEGNKNRVEFWKLKVAGINLFIFSGV